MATTGSKIGSFNGSTANCASLIAEWSYTQDINKNTTSLTVALKIRRDKSGTTTHKLSTPYKFIVDGIKKSGSYDFDITSISVGSSKTITTITKTITHNSDGTYKDISITGSFDVSGTTLGTGTVSTSLTLDTIPRATTPTVSDSSVDMGTSVTFTFDRASSAFTHDLIYSFEDGPTETIGTDIATSKDWTVPNLASDIPNNTSGICKITCITYNGTTLVGTKSITMTLKVPTSVKPTVAINVSEAVAEVANKLGVYVKGLSKLKIKATGSGAYGSSIVSCIIKANENTYNSNEVETDILAHAGAKAVTAIVTDSRGRIGTETVRVNVVDYNKPYITTFTVDRTTGSEVNVVINGGVTDIAGNTPTYTLEYKKKSEDSYTKYLIPDTTASIDKTITLTTIDPDYQYNFKLTVADPFNNMILTYDIGTEFTLVDYNASGKGMALGKVSEEPDKLEIALPLKFNGNTLVDLIYPIGSIFMSVNNINPGTYFGGTWETWGSGKVPVGVDTTIKDFETVEKTGGEITHILTESEMPAHTHVQNAHKHSIRYKGFNISSSTSGYMVLRRNDSADSYDGTDTDGAISATATNQKTGGDQAHNNLQPYITCYMWKRTL